MVLAADVQKLAVERCTHVDPPCAECLRDARETLLRAVMAHFALEAIRRH